MEVLNQRPHVLEFVKVIAQEQNINNFNIIDVQTNEKGEGYLGEIFMITAEDNITKKNINVVIKAAFTDKTIRIMVPLRNAYLNEINFYNVIYPTFKKFEEERGIKDNKVFVPKCYKTTDKEFEEMLCVENLKSLNFEMFNRYLDLDDEHFSLIFENYGRFHAYSFALQDQNPELYSKLINGTYNIYTDMVQSEPMQQHFKNFYTLVVKSLDVEADSKILEKFKTYSDDGIVKYYADIITAKPSHSVILHGDCWSNNMMFQYETTSSGKKLQDMRLLDFQVVRVGTPVCDLSYCLYAGGSKQIYDNYEKYLRIYHNSLSSFLKKLGSDSEKLFPYEIFKTQWQQYSKFGVISALAMIKMKCIKTEDVLDLSSDITEENFAELANQVKFDEEKYANKIKDLLYHAVEIDSL